MGPPQGGWGDIGAQFQVVHRGVRAELHEHGVHLGVDLRRGGRAEGAVGKERDQQARSGRHLLGHHRAHVGGARRRATKARLE
jgi:hypothetical protein